MKYLVSKKPKDAFEDVLRAIDEQPTITKYFNIDKKTAPRTYKVSVSKSAIKEDGFEIEILVNTEHEPVHIENITCGNGETRVLVTGRFLKAVDKTQIKLICNDDKPYFKEMDFEAVADHLYMHCRTEEDRHRSVQKKNNKTVLLGLLTLALICALFLGSCVAFCSSEPDYSDYLNSEQGAEDFGKWLRTEKGL